MAAPSGKETAPCCHWSPSPAGRMPRLPPAPPISRRCAPGIAPRLREAAQRGEEQISLPAYQWSGSSWTPLGRGLRGPAGGGGFSLGQSPAPPAGAAVRRGRSACASISSSGTCGSRKQKVTERQDLSPICSPFVTASALHFSTISSIIKSKKNKKAMVEMMHKNFLQCCCALCCSSPPPPAGRTPSP